MKSKSDNKLVSLGKYILPIITLKKLSTLKKIWFAFIVIVGLLLTLLVPPLQKPDEYIHLRKAISISNGLIICGSPGTVAKIQTKYNNLYETVDKYGVTQNATGRFYYGEYLIPPFVSSEQNATSDFDATVICSFPTISYVPQAFGLTLSNILSLNEIIGFYLGRLLALFLFLGVLATVIYFSKPNFHIVFLTFASIPMVLHQVGSYNYDSVQMTVGLVLFYYLFKLIEQKSVSLKQFGIFFGILLLFYFTKPQSYWFMFLTPLLFVDGLIKGIGIKKFLALLAIGFIGVSSLFFSSQSALFFATQAPQNIPITPVQLQSTILKENPFQLAMMMYETTETEFLFYLKSLIGIFGWLDYQIGDSVYVLFILLFGYSLSRFSLQSKHRALVMKSLSIVIILFGSYALNVLGMYLFHTPNYYDIGGYVSYGTQGRYFLLLLPLVFLYFGYVHQSKFIKIATFVLVSGFIIFRLGNALYFRFYDYQTLYDVPEIFSEQRDDTDAILEVKPLQEKKTIALPLDPSRRIKGITLGYVIEEKGIFMPYRYELLEGNCLDTSSRLSNGLTNKSNIFNNQLTLLLDKPIVVSSLKNNSVCILIEPIIQDKVYDKSIKLYLTDGELQALPVYNR